MAVCNATRHIMANRVQTAGETVPGRRRRHCIKDEPPPPKSLSSGVVVMFVYERRPQKKRRETGNKKDKRSDKAAPLHTLYDEPGDEGSWKYTADGGGSRSRNKVPAPSSGGGGGRCCVSRRERKKKGKKNCEELTTARAEGGSHVFDALLRVDQRRPDGRQIVGAPMSGKDQVAPARPYVRRH